MKQRCRCCLTINSNIYYNIFEHHKSGTTYAESIRYLAEVQIDHDDGLPQQICSKCYNEVQRIYNFGINVRLADEKLRQELEASKTQVEMEEVHIENEQVLDTEYFAPVDENEGMQVCVMEEILEQDMEDMNEVEEIQIVEEILEPVTDLDNRKENLLVGLAQVAATQENVNVSEENHMSNENSFLPDDENDADYLIEYDANEVNNFTPSKWKCCECKVILRGDVSYEGHMNIHKQIRPHSCSICQYKYRCRTALKRHKDLKHVPTQNNTNSIKILYLCMSCKKNFYSENIFNLHQAVVHDQGDKNPFASCKYENTSNLKEHIENLHKKDINFNPQIVCFNESPEIIYYQCFKCSTIFEEFSGLSSHINQCNLEIADREQPDENVAMENSDIIEIVKVDSTEISVQCNICAKKLLKKNLHKHMEVHRRKEDESKGIVEDTKQYLCAFCPREFKNSKSLHQHEKSHHGENSDIVYVCTDCEKQYASQYLLETHRKQAHKERDNICKICGNAFKLRSQLVNHMKLHLEKNIPCPHCDKKYARNFDLNVHLRSHTGELPYACHLCDRRFAIKVRLTYHLQKHYGIKHHCKECGAEFNSKQKLKAHSFKHTGMPYRCQLCDDHGFATRNTFKRHLTRVHHASISEEELNDMFQRNTGKNVNIKQVDEQSLILTASEDDNQEEIEVLGK
ncbi:uncharacterized protein ACRADG_006419 isoform 1-T1 [Cochliomyia hominivorax]